MSLKYLSEKSNYLKCQTILSNVIENFKNHWNLSQLIICAMVLNKHFGHIVHFIFLSCRFFGFKRIGLYLLFAACFTEIHFDIIQRDFLITMMWTCRDVKPYSTFVFLLIMLLSMIFDLILRWSSWFNETIKYWYSLGMFFIFYFIKIVLKLWIFQILFVLFPILKVLIWAFVFPAPKRQKKRTLCCALHRNSWVFINVYNLENWVYRKISWLRYYYLLNLFSYYFFLYVFRIFWIHFTWNCSYFFIKVIDLTEKYFLFFGKLS